MRLGLHDPDRTPPGVDEKCAELNKLDRIEGNRKSLAYVEELSRLRAFEKARRAIMLLYLDQPERIEARCRLAAASRQYEDIFALKVILDEGSVGRQPDPKTLAEARLLVTSLDTMKPPTQKRRRSAKGLEPDDDADAEEPEADAAETGGAAAEPKEASAG